jgi:membrane protease YdiL (CAAX protease family)
MCRFKITTACFLLFTLAIQTRQVSAEVVDPDRKFSRPEVLGLSSISLASNCATIFEIGLIEQEQMENYDIPWWMLATIGTHHLPLYALDPVKALTFTLPDAAFIGAHLATKEMPLLTSVPFSLFAYNEFFSTYEIYKTARLRAEPGAYPQEWKSYTRKDLILSPFMRENISDPLFYTTVLATSAAQIISSIKSNDAVWKTGEAWIDGKEYPVGTAVFYTLAANWLQYTATAVGEEALYRGVIYEELKVSMGHKKAKLADMLLFPAVHIPTDIARGKTLPNMAIQFLIRSSSTLLFDYAYDRGGLPLSTAIHTWFNFVALSMGWAKTGGTAAPESESGAVSSAIVTPMSIYFTFRL